MKCSEYGLEPLLGTKFCQEILQIHLSNSTGYISGNLCIDIFCCSRPITTIFTPNTKVMTDKLILI